MMHRMSGISTPIPNALVAAITPFVVRRNCSNIPLLDYAQESGRAGRDHLPSEAIIIQPEGFDEVPAWFDPNTPREQAGLELVRQYMFGDHPCRRGVLDTMPGPRRTLRAG
jgi:hypothetical protein